MDTDEVTPYDDTELFGEADMELPLVKSRIEAVLTALDYMEDEGRIEEEEMRLLKSLLMGTKYSR